MEYLRVRWVHNHSSEPIILISELDADRFELRKIEKFRDGKIGTASVKGSTPGTRLGEAPVPPLNVIEADPQFVIEPCSPSDFEQEWRSALGLRDS